MTDSSLEEQEVSGPYGSDVGSHRKYRPTVTYEYEVAGSKCAGPRIAPDPARWYESRDEAGAVIAPFAIGARVPVYYRPSRPRLAVLDRGRPGRWWRGLGLALALLAAGLVVIHLYPIGLAPGE